MLKKFIQYAMGNFLALLLGFISSPIITRIISPEEMGKFSLFNTVTSLLFLFVMLGTDQAYVRFYNNESEEGRIGLLHKCLKISLLVGIGTSIGIICFYPQISSYIYGKESIMVVCLLIANIFSNVLQRFAVLQIRMNLKGKLYSIMNVWHKLSYILMVFAFFIWLKNSSYVLMAATVVSNILCYITCVIVDRKIWFCKEKCYIKITTIELMKYGFPFVFSNAINWIFEYMDRMAIRKYCDFTEVGIYSAASTIVALLTACQNAFSAFWVPIAYEKYENDKHCDDFFCKMNRIVSYVMILVAFGMVAGKDLIIFLLGEEYHKAMFVFPFLTFMPVMYTISETTVIGINFKKQTKMHIVIASSAAISNLIGNTILVPIYGAKGAAISTGLAYVVFFLVRTLISKKLYPMKYKLKHLYFAMFMLSILAIYASFYVIDLFIVGWTILSTVLISIFYRDVVVEGISYFKNIIKTYVKKRSNN